MILVLNFTFVLSVFVFLPAAIATLTFVGSQFWLHCHVCRDLLMLMCWNSPWWQSCECRKNFSVFPLPSITHSTQLELELAAWSSCMCVNWNEQ